MKIHEVDQGTTEWMRLRLGIPTGSQFDKILTPTRLKPSSSRRKYRAEILAEWLLGQPLEWGSSGWMERGQDMEAEARGWYAFDRDVEVREVGFVTRDDGLVGGSPDGLVGDDGGVEIKCLAAKNHVLAMLGEAKDDYRGQVQGYLYLTGRQWWDLVFYNPDLPPVVTRVERDPEYIEALLPVLGEFVEQIEDDKERLSEHKVTRPWDPEIQAELQASEAAQRARREKMPA